MNKNASLIRSVIASALLICVLPLAHAQWSWKDKDGRRVFSDQPPPSSVSEKDILKRPAGVSAPAPAANADSTSAASSSDPKAAAAAGAAAPKVSGKDAELEKKKKEVEAQEAAKKKAEAEKTAAAQKENCERAKRSKSGFDSGVRISTTNAKGEREIMDEATRAAESKRLQDIIANDCK
ncbi:DUF4124 domain-containing protein [Variovorax sp. PCZ-1]|uniref:DUF4124 domain-containing protein n=1 Tax=Variovorax sp. PCZ-1 TaxID=2835533 RepID=UPI001BCAE944|nr:DUF4124 domain-containing protein [Variovorax sp. PCZ-1]MBS7807800.1 DUF4124 domain-containing protein [Variovorax sp. PCZ-1]